MDLKILVVDEDSDVSHGIVPRLKVLGDFKLRLMLPPVLLVEEVEKDPPDLLFVAATLILKGEEVDVDVPVIAFPKAQELSSEDRAVLIECGVDFILSQGYTDRELGAVLRVVRKRREGNPSPILLQRLKEATDSLRVAYG